MLRAPNTVYYLESSARNLDLPPVIVLDASPITIGRSSECSVSINSSGLSRVHARIEWQGDELVFEDKKSTNGSYVNYARVDQPVILKCGDVVHFCDIEYSLKSQALGDAQHHDDKTDAHHDDKTQIGSQEPASTFPAKGREFLELLDKGLVVGYQQTIVDRQHKVYGVESLGRGIHPELGPSPYEMFSLAHHFGKEVQLSELLRRKSFEQSAKAGISLPVFFNCHPAECMNPTRLFTELSALRQLYPQLKLVFEVHEGAMTNSKLMHRIRSGLDELDIGLAYDDFGAGQSRLKELTETPPDILKFDISLISGVGEPSSSQYRLLASVNTMLQDLGVTTLAEGVETQGEADACLDIGIDLFQGYFFDRPSVISSIE